MICNADEKFLRLITRDRRVITMYSKQYPVIEKLLDNRPLEDDNDRLIQTMLEKQGCLAWMRENAGLVREKMKCSLGITAPENSFAVPSLLNLELTTRCPLRCPQCYCHLQEGKDLSVKRAVDVLEEAASIGVANIALSGGETMAYPHLYELTKRCAALGLYSSVALSGWGVDATAVKKLTDSGVSWIFVSLNGSVEEVSRLSRDGHHLAVRTLELLKTFENKAVNWVAHSFNIDDFANVARLCAHYGVRVLTVLVFKPDSANKLESLPDKEQLKKLAKEITSLKKELPDLSIEAESCYSPLRAFMSQTFWGNSNVGIQKGCAAGRDAASLDIDGNFTPCRHLDFPERFGRLSDYWKFSDTLREIRAVEKSPGEPCAGCRYEANCLSCLAVGAKLHGHIKKANRYCSLWQ